MNRARCPRCDRVLPCRGELVQRSCFKNAPRLVTAVAQRPGFTWAAPWRCVPLDTGCRVVVVADRQGTMLHCFPTPRCAPGHAHSFIQAQALK